MGDVKEDTLRELAGLIADIEAGRVVAVALSTEHHDGTVSTWCAIGDRGNRNTLIGGVATLQHRMITDEEW